MSGIGTINSSISTGFVNELSDVPNPENEVGGKVSLNKNISGESVIENSANIQDSKQEALSKSKMAVQAPQNPMADLPKTSSKSGTSPSLQVDKSNIPVLNLGELEKLEVKSAKGQLADIMDLFANVSKVDAQIFGAVFDFIKQAGVENKGKWWDINAAGDLIKSYFKNEDKEKLKNIVGFANSPKFKSLLDALSKYRDDVPYSNAKEHIARSRVQHESSKILNTLEFFNKVCEKYAEDNKLGWNNMVSIEGQSPVGQDVITGSLKQCWDNALAEVSDHMEKGSSQALRYGMYILTQNNISDNDLDELKKAIDGYYKNIGLEKGKISMAMIPFGCHTKVDNSELQTILKNVADLKKDNKLSGEYLLFLDDLEYKINNKISYDSEINNVEVNIFGSDIAKLQFVKSNLGFSLLHWLKNLFTFGKTYSRNEENFRDNMLGFVKSLDNKEQFELLRKLDNGKDKEMLKGFIRDAIKNANSDMADEKVAKYTDLALEIFAEEFKKWEDDNPHLKTLAKEFDVEILGANHQKDNMEDTLANFVKSVMFKDNMLEMGQALAKLYGNYMQVAKDDGSVVNYNRDKEFKALVAKLPVGLKKAFIEQLTDVTLSARDNLNKIYAICLYTDIGDTVKGINGQNITAFIQKVMIPAFCDIDKDNSKIREEAQQIIEVYNHNMVNDAVSANVSFKMMQIIRDKRASIIG